LEDGLRSFFFIFVKTPDDAQPLLGYFLLT